MSENCLHYLNSEQKLISFNAIDFRNHIPRNDELSFVNTEDSIPFQPKEECYLISAEWLDRWYAYVSNEGESARPGLISNETIIDPKTRKIKADVTLKTDFRPIKRSTWEYLFSLYGSRVVIYFQVPEVFDEKAYKKGTWAKNMNFHMLDISVIYPSHDVPSSMPERGKSFDLSLKEIALPSDSSRREIIIKPRTSYEISIIGHELKKTDSQNDFHIVYIVEIVPPDDSEDAQAWRVSRRYDDFFALHGYLRHNRNLSIPKLPGKRYFRSSRSQSFLDQRQKRLEIYLKALAAQAIIWEHVDFKRFIDRHVNQYKNESIAYYNLLNANKDGNRGEMKTPLLETKKNPSIFSCCWKKSPPTSSPEPPAPNPTPPPTQPKTDLVPLPSPVEEGKDVPIDNYTVLERSSADGSFSSFRDSSSDIHSGESNHSTHSYQPRFKSNRRHSALPSSSSPDVNLRVASPSQSPYSSFDGRATSTNGESIVSGSSYRTGKAESRRSYY